MSILSSSAIRSYAGGWSEVERESLSNEEVRNIKNIEVTSRENEWGTSISFCFTMVNGVKKFIPMHRDCSLEEGDTVDPSSVEIITLERDGDAPCYKATGEKLKRERR